ncbi:cytochrome P450 [Artemisia annua]|uniref:Cytochrome P450 n=1 Tax=Artemisia annua TaxID=35608 RepID=A0A2U1MJ10_ARTAN|nr:cytochrome P450 [Artemisia annua]
MVTIRLAEFTALENLEVLELTDCGFSGTFQIQECANDYLSPDSNPSPDMQVIGDAIKSYKSILRNSPYSFQVNDQVFLILQPNSYQVKIECTEIQDQILLNLTIEVHKFKELKLMVYPGLPEIPIAQAFEPATEATVLRFVSPTMVQKIMRLMNI